MKTAFEEFKVMSLRPAFYNGTQFEAEIIFNEANAYSVDITEAEAVNMIPGDTVRINGKITDDTEKDYDFISVYMCGEELTEFIEKYGIHKVSGTVRMKLEIVYSVYEYNEYGMEPIRTEKTVFRLLGIVEVDRKD